MQQPTNNMQPQRQPRKYPNRIVLLFDLDCFYAQCECVRLGLSSTDVSLALLQWNSVLAVTYPARKAYNIKRGDSWDAVQAHGDCWGVHLHILEKNGAQSDNEEDEDVEKAYNRIYNQSAEEQQKCQQRDRGRRRFSHEGKACLERYRVASQRIFQVVLESLSKRIASTKQSDDDNANDMNSNKDHKHASTFILERASIDEFYLDITAYCFDINQTGNENIHTHASNNDSNLDEHTKVIGGTSSTFVSDEFGSVYRRACQVAQWIRKDVWDRLGFTMTAGISSNKMMAKLAASHGKPNGQAVIFPSSFDRVLRSTKMRKVRHFGGKLGTQAHAIFAAHAGEIGSNRDIDPTMSNIQELSLPILQKEFRSKETARFVFDTCRGIDIEPVKETTGALVKSITAFKSFGSTSQPKEVESWLTLIAGEIVKRVNADASRNQRYPKICTLTYGLNTEGGKHRPDGSWKQNQETRSLRLKFPPQSDPGKASTLAHQAMERLGELLQNGSAIRRIGLSANNFETKAQPPDGITSIDTFFKHDPSTSQQSTGSTRSQISGPKQTAPKQSGKIVATSNASVTAKRTQAHMKGVAMRSQPISSQAGTKRGPNEPTCGDDHEVAKKLQAAFDRENYVLSTSAKKEQKIRKIDSFFKRR